jgi:hypothetical protein
MHAALLTVLLAAVAEQPSATVAERPSATVAERPSAVIAERHVVVAEACCSTGCGRCNHAAGCRCCTLILGCLAACCRPTPQSCYAPRSGCCAGHHRCAHCYPTFPSYYRQAYNYRNQFDYPWHAMPHEPRPLFTFQGRTRPPTQEVIPTPYPEPESVPFELLPLAPDSP